MVEIKEEDIGYDDEYGALSIKLNEDEYFKLKQQILQNQEDAMKGYSPEAIIQAEKDRQIVKKIKDRLFAETGQTNYITAYDLKQILEGMDD